MWWSRRKLGKPPVNPKERKEKKKNLEAENKLWNISAANFLTLDKENIDQSRNIQKIAAVDKIPQATELSCKLQCNRYANHDSMIDIM